MQINGNVAVVTGGGSGLGAATARDLAEQGAKVVVLDSNSAAAETIAAQVKGLAIQCDVSDAASVTSALAAIQEKYGTARIWVNCAGIAPAARVVGRQGPMPLEDFAKVIQVNLLGTFNCIRLAAAAMYQLEAVGDSQERGVIINTASVAAFEGQIGQVAYSASKAGIVGMTLPLAREFADVGIRVMTIAPGLMATPLLLNMDAKIQEALAAAVPFPKRLGKPEEFAALALHIIENSMLNGEVIRLDGALRMGAR